MKNHGPTLAVFSILILMPSISKAQPPSIEKAKEERKEGRCYSTEQCKFRRCVWS